MAERTTSRLGKALRWAAGGLAGFIVLVAVAWLFGALNPVGLWAAGRVTGYEISCGEFSGDVFGSFTCTNLTLADAKGRFLVARQFTLNWNVWALLGNKASLKRVALTDAVLSRVPESEPSSSSDVLPSIEIAVGQLDISHFRLAMRDAPGVCLDLGGKAMAGPKGFDAALTFVRCKPRQGRLTFTGRYDKPSGALRLSANGRDDGALARELTGIKSAGITRLTLAGSGTIGAFTGRLDGRAEGIGDIAAAFKARELTATSLQASFSVARSLRPAWAPKARGTLVAEFARTSGDGFDIRSSALDWGGFHATLRLTRDANGALAGLAVLGAREPFAVEDTQIGGMNLRAQIGGTQSRPVLTGVAKLSGVTAAGNGFEALQTNFRIGLADGALQSANAVGHVDGTALVTPLGDLIGPKFGFHGTASRQANGALVLDAAVNSVTATLAAKARIGESTGTGSLKFTVPDLAKTDMGLSGAVTAELTLDTLTLQGDVDGGLRIAGSNISPSGVGAALGPTPTLTAQIRAVGGSYALSDIRLDTAAVSLGGVVTAPATAALTADLQTTRGNLAPLSDFLGMPLDGAFALRATASGTGAAPRVTLVAQAPKMSVRGNVVTNASLRIDAAKSVGWDGRIVLDAATPSGAIALAATAETAEHGWSLRVTKGDLGPAKLAGGISASGNRLAGALTLSGDVLAPAAALTGTALRGSGSLSLRGDGAGLRFTADLKDVAAGPLTQATIKAEASARALNAPIAASLSVKDGVDHLAASASIARNPLAITLDRFAGQWAGADFALARPAMFTRKEGGFTLGRSRIGIAGGTLTLSAAGQGDALNADIHLSDMPAGPVATLLKLGKAKGTLGLDATAAMAPGKTQAELRFDAKDLIFAGAGKKAKPADLAFNANWDGALLSADGKITGLDAEPATLSTRIPVVRAHDSYMPKLAQSGAVFAKLRAQMRAERLVALLPLAEQSASGALTVSADVSGDIAQPQFSGKIALAKGAFENFETGTKLENVTASIEAVGGSNAVLELDATDGSSGTVKAKGEFSMAELETGGIGRLAGHLDLTLNKARVLRQDMADATATGSLAIDLPGDQPPHISGNLKTETVRVDLGAAIPPDVPQIKVTEINAGVSAAPPPEKPSRFSKGTLDIALSMPNRIYVTGHGVDSEWNGNLKIAGTLGAPDISGKLALVRGQAELIGKSFTLKEGRVVPDNAAKGGATVHLVAENESSDITVTVTADGPVADPKLTWTSSPSLPKDEILSRLFFGASTPHISAFQAFQLAQLSGQLGSLGGLGGGGGGILSFARRLTGLDVLRVEAPSDLNGTSASIAAGKYITDNVYVGVKQGASVSAGAAQVQVKITPNISVEAEAGTNSQGSVGATWKWDY